MSEVASALDHPILTPQPAALVPRVRWGRATAIHLLAGLIAGFMVPFYFFILRQLSTYTGDVSGLAIWTAICVASAVVVALFGAGIPLLVAWLSWLVVSRHGRGLRRELLAVVLGAIGGSLIPSALPFLFMSSVGSDWTYYAFWLVALGVIPGAAFALWVANAWRRARKQVLSSQDEA